jgi:hypothetical protein
MLASWKRVGLVGIVFFLGMPAYAWEPKVETTVEDKVVSAKISSDRFGTRWIRCWGEIRGEYRDGTHLEAPIDFFVAPGEVSHTVTLESKTEPFVSGSATVNCEWL